MLSFFNAGLSQLQALHVYGNLGMGKWYRVPVRDKYQISRTDSIFGTDILRFLYLFSTGIYFKIMVRTGTVPYWVFSVPVSIPIFRDIRYRYPLVLTSS
ncbi:hypothetical protein Hanom_Chr14g01290461 [Helianthus anomalus]